MVHQHPVIGQEVIGQLPELVGRLPQDHGEEHEPRPQLPGHQRLELVVEAGPVLVEELEADRQVAALVPPDVGEEVLEHRVAGVVGHAAEQRRGGDLTHHE